jgi:hypothetical protein
MSVFTTKVDGRKVTVVAQNVALVVNDDKGNAEIHFTNGTILGTDVGYDSVRKNVAKSLGKPAEDKAE